MVCRHVPKYRSDESSIGFDATARIPPSCPKSGRVRSPKFSADGLTENLNAGAIPATLPFTVSPPRNVTSSQIPKHCIPKKPSRNSKRQEVVSKRVFGTPVSCRQGIFGPHQGAAMLAQRDHLPDQNNQFSSRCKILHLRRTAENAISGFRSAVLAPDLATAVGRVQAYSATMRRHIRSALAQPWRSATYIADGTYALTAKKDAFVRELFQAHPRYFAKPASLPSDESCSPPHPAIPRSEGGDRDGDHDPYGHGPIHAVTPPTTGSGHPGSRTSHSPAPDETQKARHPDRRGTPAPPRTTAENEIRCAIRND